jgi:hypothetical protein
MPRKPCITHNDVKIWRVYDGGDSRAYWFAWHPGHTEDGDDFQFDVRDLSTYRRSYEEYIKQGMSAAKAYAGYQSDIRRFIKEAIDKEEILPDGPIPRDDNNIKEHRPEKLKLIREVYEAKRRQTWEEMINRFNKSKSEGMSI